MMDIKERPTSLRSASYARQAIQHHPSQCLRLDKSNIQ